MPVAKTEALPAGTVTFLFLDIEQSTDLLQRIGPEYPGLLGVYREVTERMAASHDGVVFGSEGDGLFLAFPEAGAAVTAAVESQKEFATRQWPADSEVRVRMGIHTGSPTLIGDDYTGIDVHRAARITAAGWGGQILLSESTQALLAGGTWVCRELGWFTMRGLSRDERLYQVEAPGLPSEFPPVRARRREVRLPVHMNSLFGREADVDAVAAMLTSGARLVTLSGPGGIGKSRVAIAVAEMVESRYQDGVVYADVSNETDPGRMAVALVESLGVSRGPQQSALETLAEHCAPLRMLLVLDGFERIAEAAVQVSDLLSRCPYLQILITSRVVLRIGAEREYRVRSLSVPPPGSAPGVVMGSPAVELFVDRARAASPGFELTKDNSAAIRDLVAALDGVPLSIELAGARSRLLTPEAILARLGNILDLDGASPDLPMRQQSLRSTIEWSHSLLDDTEQRLLRRLGVFSGGWTIEAVERVADGEADVLSGLENLVAHSLIQVEPEGRMSMGTAMREFAVEGLAEAGEEDEVRLRHASFFADLAEESEPLLRGRRQRELLLSLSRDWSNFRTAGEWALAGGHLELAARLYTNIWILSWQSDYWGESEMSLRALAPHIPLLDEPLRSRVLFIAGGTYMEIGEWEKALEFARPGLELAQRLGDRQTESWTRLIIAGSIVTGELSDPEAREQIRSAVAIARTIDDPFVLGYSLSFMGTISTLDGDMTTAFASHLECLEIARSIDNPGLTAQTLSQIAMTHLAAGSPVEARRALEEGSGVLDDVRSLEVLAVFLDAVAWLAFAESDQVRAMTALGAADATRARVGAARWSLLAGLLDSVGLAAEGEQPTLADARRAGSEMSTRDAIGFGLSPHRELAAVG